MTGTLAKPVHATKHCRHYSYRNTGIAGYRRGDLGGQDIADAVEAVVDAVIKEAAQ